MDIDVPESIQRTWSAYEQVFQSLSTAPCMLCTSLRLIVLARLLHSTAMLDLMFEERGHASLKEFQDELDTRSAPLVFTSNAEDQQRARCRTVEEPPLRRPPRSTRNGEDENGTAGDQPGEYGGLGRSVQFHPSTTYENFVGGLAPLHGGDSGEGGLGFRFAPKPGYLLEAAAHAADSTKPYLLHIDEINGRISGRFWVKLSTYSNQVRNRGARLISLMTSANHFIDGSSYRIISTYLER